MSANEDNYMSADEKNYKVSKRWVHSIGRWLLRHGAPAVVAAFAGLAVGATTAESNVKAPEPQPIRTVTVPADLTADGIVFNLPPNSQIPLCASFSGTTTLDRSWNIWVAFVYDHNSEYFFMEADRDPVDSTRWKTVTRRVGVEASTGQSYRIYAFATTPQWNAFLKSMKARAIGEQHQKIDGYWYSMTLPSNLEPVATVVRTSERGSCSR